MILQRIGVILMKITSVKISRTFNNNRQIADVSIIIDRCLLINNIKLLSNDKRVFVEFSSTRRRNSNITFPDVVPLNSKTRMYIENKIISEYQTQVNQEGHL